MVQLLTWEWLARDILFQLANDRCIGLPWRRSVGLMLFQKLSCTTLHEKKFLLLKCLKCKLQLQKCILFFLFFVCRQSRKTMEEKLNEKRQHLHPPPEFSEEDRKAHAIAMVLYKDCEK